MGGSQGGAGPTGNNNPTEIAACPWVNCYRHSPMCNCTSEDAPSVGNCRPEATGPESILPFVAGSRPGMANNAGENPPPSGFFSWDGARFPRISGGSQQFPSLDSEPSIKLTTWGDRIWSQP